MNNNYFVPRWIIENKLNPDVASFYLKKYGNLDRFKQLFTETYDDQIYIKPEYLDFVTRVSSKNVLISFVVTNDASVANRRYQESYICQTPILYAYDDLVRLFNENIPKVRQRNATRTYIEPIIPLICAEFFILKALMESTMVNGNKEITMTISGKSLKVNYSFDESKNTKEMLDIRKEYFDMTCVNTEDVEKKIIL